MINCLFHQTIQKMEKYLIHYTFVLVLLFFTVFSFASSERYRLILTDDPATTIMIAWDQISGTNPVVYYDTLDFGTDWQNYSFSKEVDRTVVYKGMNNQFVKLLNLLPETNYYFIIKDEEGTSQRFWFKTAPNTNKQMSFIAGGDSRNNRLPRQNANLIVSKLKPTAVFFGGDMTNGDSATEWIEWFDDWQLTTAVDGRMFPILPTRGNHEYENETIYNLFNVPSQSIYYDITFGENLFTIYTLNTQIPCGGNQCEWLENSLINNTSIWKSAQYHKPMRSHVSHKPEGNDQYNNWAELFYQQHVRLIIESDSHDVKTTWPIKPCSEGVYCEEGFIRDNNNGSVYVGEGCWGAPLRESDDAKNWTRNSGSFNQIKWICVSEENIKVNTILVNDSFNINENDNTSVCTLPDGIEVWNPSNGDTVVITKPTIEIPTIKIISPHDGDLINEENTIIIEVDSSHIEVPIISILIKDNDKFIGLFTNTTNSLTYRFEVGFHTISVIAFCEDSLFYKDRISIFVESAETDTQFNVYPNPVKGKLYFEFPDIEKTLWKLSIYTLSGQRILFENILNNEVNISHLSSGNYIIKVFSDNNEKVFTRKISINN